MYNLMINFDQNIKPEHEKLALEIYYFAIQN
jgi:hypothetical protein